MPPGPKGSQDVKVPLLVELKFLKTCEEMPFGGIACQSIPHFCKHYKLVGSKTLGAGRSTKRGLNLMKLGKFGFGLIG